MSKDRTCGCGLYIYPTQRNPDAIHCSDCPHQNDIRTELEYQYDELLAAITLYIPWEYVTKQLTTEQKELFADAVERSIGYEVTYITRWWR